MPPTTQASSSERRRHLAVEHAALRESLDLLGVVVGPVNCPPPGHMYFGMLASLSGFFVNEVTDHAAHEEAVQYPALAERMRPGELAQLCLDHRNLAKLSGLFAAATAEVQARPSEVAWAAVREQAVALATLLADHFRREEAIADRPSL